MIFVFGHRFYGKVDEVPGLFHVATKFAHFDYIPLIPTQSFLILGRNGNQIRGVKIALSAKSVFIGWGRALSLAAALAALIGLLVTLNSPRATIDWTVFAAIAVLSGIAYAVLSWYPGLRRASFHRACQLAQIVRLNEAGIKILERHYGQAVARGFEVSGMLPANLGAGRNEPVDAVIADWH